MSKAALEAGKAVLCEKPLSMSVAEAQEMVDLAEAKKLPNCVNHNLRFYPVVQQIRRMIEAGELGEILVVQGTYSQDWLLYDTDYNWRIEKAGERPPPRRRRHRIALDGSGPASDRLEDHRPLRRPPDRPQDPQEAEEVDSDVRRQDAASGRLRRSSDRDRRFRSSAGASGDRARGAYTVSQVNAGCKNRFQMEIFGTKCGVIWNQERPDELWIGHRNSPNQIILKDPSLLYPEAAAYADLPGGHSEGYDDTHKQIFRRFYAKVADPSAPVEYPTFADGLHGMRLLEKVIESNEKRGWVDTV